MNDNAMLTEYQALWNYNNSIATQYWTMAGIFIGFSSVLLGGLIYGVLSNNDLLQILLGIKPSNEGKEFLIVGIAAYVLSIAVLLILYFLKGWLKRFTFLQQTNFQRIREIELELGMFNSLRVHAIDNWDKLEEAERDRIEEFYGKQWRDNSRKSCSYEPSSSRLHFPGIFCTLFGLWFLVLLGSFYLLCVYSCVTSIITLVAIILICAVIFLYTKWLRRQSRDC